MSIGTEYNTFASTNMYRSEPVKNGTTGKTNGFTVSDIDEVNGRNGQGSGNFLEDLCKQFPDISFIVGNTSESSGDKLTDFTKHYDYDGICDTTNFGDIKKKSMMISEELLSSMSDPESRKKLYDHISDISSQYGSIIGKAGANAECAYIQVLSPREIGRGKPGYEVMGVDKQTAETFLNYSNNKDTSKLDVHAMMLKKASLYAEDQYNKMVDSLMK